MGLRNLPRTLSGPFAPMGKGLDIGVPIDRSRPKIDNQDGSFSTERTITIPFNGKWYNVPTIVNGYEYPEQDIEQYFQMGLLPYVGEFDDLKRAERSAVVRSDYIGKARIAKELAK